MADPPVVVDGLLFVPVILELVHLFFLGIPPGLVVLRVFQFEVLQTFSFLSHSCIGLMLWLHDDRVADWSTPRCAKKRGRVLRNQARSKLSQ